MYKNIHFVFILYISVPDSFAAIRVDDAVLRHKHHHLPALA